MKTRKEMKTVTHSHDLNTNPSQNSTYLQKPKPKRIDLQEIIKSGDELVGIKIEIGVRVGVRARDWYQ